ncbi:hypothetical protein HYPSUDRAFT_202241 [Hypholoma sublateritium FD-334 SS-4]|uniref:Uncharacterized protein n=1 Tax=Hypholoma sublateritium (strain FD-334 SS-4) TaxID=945553 RepID=A0A0D2MFS2_HYPSF|nr:hypothetical protein HYPSUDRAFT_202241 [Hypholoma sublateritium FD-334 SS-4]
MLSFSTAALFASILFGSVQAVPVQLGKRIDQTISASTTAWEQACITAGGTRDTCSNVAVTAFTSLQESGAVCDQQNGADSMIDLAKQLNNTGDMIRLAQIFAQQPRNSPDKSQVPYCQVAPKNAELNGLFHCQFSGSNFSVFSGDQTGNVPLGLTSLNPAGSCPANPEGPIPDGVQLNTLVTEPIAASSSVGNATASPVVAIAQASATSSVAPAASVLSCSVQAEGVN